MKSKLVLRLSPILACLFFACSEDQQFSPILKMKTDTGITFNNLLTYTDNINPYTYRNFYNGSGLAIGDLDNDGLDDVFFTGNQVDNAVYRNLGDFKFEDVTKKAGLASKDSWSTGACMVDINGDNLLDIYVCKAGPPGGENRKNQLFINQGNFKFVDEAAKYGLDILGLSIQASFFDYDLDGDLDCYLLNNSLKSVGGYDLRSGQRSKPGQNGNKLLENVDGKYIERTKDLGIYNSDIGFGLGVMILDVNSDSYPDIYVSNDFFEKDYLYVNQKGKSFIESGEEYFSSFPLGSMGVDAADINNDLKPDIFVAEMLPATLERQKTKAIFDTWEKYQNTNKQGYYFQMPRNMFYLNQYPNDFVELSRMNNCNATEWSWAPLIFDIDNDGYKDMFISNGVGRDLLDRDYLTYMSDDKKVATLIREDRNALSKLIDLMPESKVPNAIFRNDATQGFENVSQQWSDMPSSVSNASAYSDLDKDGDLDLVVANVNMEAFVLENTVTSTNSWIGFELEGTKGNRNAIGASILVFSGKDKYMILNIPSRGFQSSVSTSLHLGLGEKTKVDSVLIKWPEGASSIHLDLKLNEYNRISSSGLENRSQKVESVKRKILVEVVDSIEVANSLSLLNDFNKDPLSIAMMPKTGPSFCIANLDSDLEKEIFIGGAKDMVSKIVNGRVNSPTLSLFYQKKYAAVVEVGHVDIDNDGDQDIYLAHGTRGYSQYSSELNDVLLINDGEGNFEELATNLNFPKPIITSAVCFGDIDNNGFEDIFVSESLANNIYGMPGSGYLFLNQGELNFELQSSSILNEVGMITHAEMLDLDHDGSLEVIVCGEWMGIKVFKFEDNELLDFTDELGLGSTNGMWNTMELLDLDMDGDLDILAGNVGLNNALKEDMRMTVFDFDANGKVEQIISQAVNGKYYPIHDLDDLTKQLPSIKKNYSNYSNYSMANMDEVFEGKGNGSNTLEVLETSVFINDNGTFQQKALPKSIQYSSVHAISSLDINQDGIKDIVLGGNNYNYKPQYGNDEASSGCVVLGSIVDEKYEFGEVITLGIEGEIRTIKAISDTTMMVGLVNRNLYTYKLKTSNE